METSANIISLISAYVPNLIGALIILVVGWIISLIIAAIFRKVMHRIHLNKRVAEWTGEREERAIDLEKGISKGIFYILMLFILVAFFQTLGVTLITEPLNSLLNTLFAFAPKLIGAGALLLIAWVIASIARLVVSKSLSAARIDERLGTQAGLEEEKAVPLTKSLSDVVYWLVFLLFLPAVLGSLEMTGLLEPVQGMINKVLNFLPNLLTAGIILFIGWFIARVIQQIVTNMMVSIKADTLVEKAGLTAAFGNQKLSKVTGILVFALIIIPVLIAALNTLALEAITVPASDMLNMILAALPAIFAAIFVLAVAYFIGRMLAGVVTNLLSGIGFNQILIRTGLQKELPEGKRTPSEFAGILVLLAVLFFAALEASRLLGFTALATLISEFMFFAGHIIFGLVIFALGLYFANLAYRKVRESETAQANLLAAASRVVIIVLASAMALRQMGLANEIINLAFGILFGAVAVALAIAFGIGGRDIAARKLEDWTQLPKSQ